MTIFNKITQVSASALMLTGAIAILSFISTNNNKDYATLDYDGGWTSLGYIEGIDYESRVTVSGADGEVYFDGLDDAISELKKIGNGQVKDGLILKYTPKYEYKGSERNFTLNLATVTRKTNGLTGFAFAKVIQELEDRNKLSYKTEALSELDFKKSPPIL